MKKIIAIISVVCLLTGVMAGCSKKADTTKQKVTVTFMASQDWVRPGEQALAKTFEAQTGIHIDYQIIPSAQYPNMLSAKLSSGECTDIYGNNTDPYTLGTVYSAAKNAVDLSSQSWAKTEDPMVKWDSTVNGKLYGLTCFDTSEEWVVVYNKTIFAKYQLSVPKTFAEFETVCQTLKDKGITPIYEPCSDGWHQALWFPELGGAIGDSVTGLVDKLNNNQTTFSAIPAAKTALDQIEDLVKKGYWGSNYLSDTVADTEKNMASGKYAMNINNFAEPDNIATADSSASASNFGLFPNPVLDNQYQDINPGGPTEFIWTGSKHIKQAEQYFDFLTKTDNIKALISNAQDKFETLPFTGAPNNYSDAVNTYFTTYPKKATVLQISVKYVDANWMDIGKDMNGMFVGSETSSQVLSHLDDMRSQGAQAAKDSNWSK